MHTTCTRRQNTDNMILFIIGVDKYTTSLVYANSRYSKQVITHFLTNANSILGVILYLKTQEIVIS